MLAAAAIVGVVALGGVALRLALADAKVRVVATVPTAPDGRGSTPPPPNPTTTSTEVELPTSTTTPTEGAAATTTVRPSPGAVAPVTTTAASVASTTSTSLAASPGPTVTTTTTTAGSGSSPRVTAIRGTATWIGGRDPRARLEVGACPVGSSEHTCGDEWRVTEVRPDGSFELFLPTEDSPRDWNVVALVSPSQYSCAFNCTWRVSQAGTPTTISDATPPAALDLSVSARVVDVFVRDRNNQPFAGGGVFVRDIRCPENPCPSDRAPMYSQSSSTDGAARIVVDPALTYDLFGMAQNTGWANPQYTNSDGSTSWHSPTIRRKGSDVVEGYVFLVNGAPS